MGILFCSSCGEKIELDDEAIKAGAACPNCQKCSRTLPVVAPESTPAAKCAFCFSNVEAEETTTTCPVCRAPYHEDCWQENGGCAVYGCSQAPTVEPRHSLEIPVSYWGQENKPCPACGREILAAAVRCRFCGATFVSAQPEDTASFTQRSEQEKRLPKVRQTIVWIFVLSVIPCLAPIGGLWGLVWYPIHKSDVKALPSLYGALCKMGIAVGLGQTVLMALVAIIYSITRVQ